MTRPHDEDQSAAAIQRLTVLWALNESGLGGLLHAVRSPFTGLFVGGMAILLIRLLAAAARGQRRLMLKATAIVVFVKFSVSPHSPATAYLAVGFQGLVGSLLLGRARFGKWAILAFSLLSYAQMSLQRLAVITLFYGFSLWEAIDKLAIEASRAIPWGTLGADSHASLWLIAAYVGLHLGAGLAVGGFAWQLPRRLRSHLPEATAIPAPTVPPPGSTGKKGSRLWSRIVRSLPVLAFLALAWLLIPAGGFGVALRAVLRAVLMITFWYAVVSPFGRWLIRRMLEGRASRHAREIDLVLEQLPLLRDTARQIWSAEAAWKAPKRLMRTGMALLAWALAGAAERQDHA